MLKLPMNLFLTGSDKAEEERDKLKTEPFSLQTEFRGDTKEARLSELENKIISCLSWWQKILKVGNGCRVGSIQGHGCNTFCKHLRKI